MPFYSAGGLHLRGPARSPSPAPFTLRSTFCSPSHLNTLGPRPTPHSRHAVIEAPFAKDTQTQRGWNIGDEPMIDAISLKHAHHNHMQESTFP